MKTSTTKQVVTWITPQGMTTDICDECARKYEAAGTWPKDLWGREYCTVAHGHHIGDCDYCVDNEGHSIDHL